jgi:hypothetical protein
MTPSRFENGLAIAPVAPDKLPSDAAMPVSGAVGSNVFLPVHDLPAQTAGTIYAGRLVARSPKQLHLHPALDEIGWSNAVAEINQADSSAANPSAVEFILITTGGIVLAGFGRWQLALFEGRSEIGCIEYPFDQEQALQFMLSQQRARCGWNAFVRIELALKLEPGFQCKSLANMQAGGKCKGLANLPKALQIDVRKKIAEIAGVCARNVGKVKDILKNAHPKLIDAARTQALSINRAAKLCRLPKGQQIEELTRHLCHREASRVIRQAVSRPRNSPKRLDVTSVLDALQRQEEQQPGSVEVRNSRSPRTVIVLGQDMLTGSISRQEGSIHETE